MKKTALFICFTISLLNYTLSYSQKEDFIRFSQQPSKRLFKKDLRKTNYYIEYKSKKTATIYLELIKGEKTIVANAIKTIKSRKPTNIILNIKKFPSAKMSYGPTYRYKLYMFEGERDNFKTRIGDVSHVTAVRLFK